MWPITSSISDIYPPLTQIAQNDIYTFMLKKQKWSCRISANFPFSVSSNSYSNFLTFWSLALGRIFPYFWQRCLFLHMIQYSWPFFAKRKVSAPRPRHRRTRAYNRPGRYFSNVFSSRLSSFHNKISLAGLPETRIFPENLD